MLQYLIIQLDSTSTSICHYDNPHTKSSLIGLDTLKKAIFFSMKENLTIQFLYPDYELPQAYKAAIDTIDHSDIVAATCEDKGLLQTADVVVFNDWHSMADFPIRQDCYYVLRTPKEDFFAEYKSLSPILKTAGKLNVVLTDVERFSEEDFQHYQQTLTALADELVSLYAEGLSPQLNLLTDRLVLESMNNCNAGDTTLTLAPDGKFYVCPAFYLADEEEDYGLGKAKVDVGSLVEGLDIKNPQLYRLDHAPICSHCDAWQCKRCVWLNRKTTMEVNTPGHEQCVVSHIERNASLYLLRKVRELGDFLPEVTIQEIDYLDPFDKRAEWIG